MLPDLPVRNMLQCLTILFIFLLSFFLKWFPVRWEFSAAWKGYFWLKTKLSY